jgi:O-antigen/teichoic acid export membrane protein
LIRAVAVTLLANAVARASARLSQIVVGLYLTESQVGAFAFALGINGFCCILRSGGASYYLPTIRAEEYDRRAGRYFLWGLAFASFGALLSLVSAGLLPSLTWLKGAADAPGLAPCLVLLGLRHILAPLGMLGRSRMAVNLQFAELARLDTANAILRLAITWACARAGLGALALVIPLFASSVIETVYCLIASRLTRDAFRWRNGTVRDMSRRMGWPVVTASLTSMSLQGHYLIIGTMVPVDTLGVFYFALQLTLQPVLVVGLAFQSVFAPLLSRIRGHRDAEASLIRRVFMGSMLFVPVTTLSIGGLFPLIERLIWHGKWAEASIPIAWLSVGATFATATAVLVGPLLGARHYKTLAGIELSRAIGVFGGAAIGGIIARFIPEQTHPMLQPAAIVGATTAIGMTVTSCIQLAQVMRHFGVAPADIGHHLLYGPAISGLAVVGAVSVAGSAAQSFALPPGWLGTSIELLIATVVFIGVTMFAFRTLAEETVRAVAEMLPPSYRPVYRRIMLIGPGALT